MYKIFSTLHDDHLGISQFFASFIHDIYLQNISSSTLVSPVTPIDFYVVHVLITIIICAVICSLTAHLTTLKTEVLKCKTLLCSFCVAQNSSSALRQRDCLSRVRRAITSDTDSSPWILLSLVRTLTPLVIFSFSPTTRMKLYWAS